MGEVVPQVEPGYSARLLTRAYGVPTHNRRLQNVEHGLAVRDKLRIINYIQAKPQRSSPTSPVPPHFESLTEALLASASDLRKTPSPDTEDRISPPLISAVERRARHRSGQDMSSQSQVGFSARNLPTQSRMMRRNSSTSSQGSISPDLHISDSTMKTSLPTETKTAGFSARKLSKGSGFPSRSNSSSSDASSSDMPGPRLTPCGTPDATGDKDPIALSEKGADVAPKTDFATRSPSPIKFDFAIKSPSSGSDSPLGVSARTKRAIVAKTAARKEWRNSNRPGLSSPLSDISSISDDVQPTSPLRSPHETSFGANNRVSPELTLKAGFSARSLALPGLMNTSNNIAGPTIDPRGTLESERGSQPSPVGGFSARNPPPGLRSGSLRNSPETSGDLSNRASPKLTLKAGFSARSLPPPPGLMNTSHNKTGPTIDPRGTPDSERGSQPSPVVGFSARNPPPGLSLSGSAPSTSNPSINSRSRHRSTPGPLSTTLSTSHAMSLVRSLSEGNDIAQNISDISPSKTTPPPGFSARNPPPGFNVRWTPPGFGDAAFSTGLGAKVMSANPGLVPHGTKISPPPGFGNTKSATRLSFSTSVRLPENQTLPRNQMTSPTFETSTKKLPLSSPDDAKNQSNNTVVRFVRQQVRPYLKQKDTPNISPSKTASHDKVKRTLASAREELENIKKIHMQATNTIPPHVQRLEETIERIRAKYRRKSGEEQKTVLDQNDNIAFDNKTSVQNSGDNQINGITKDDVLRSPERVRKTTWRAVSVNHTLLSSGVPQQFSFGVHAICDVLRTHGKELDEYNKDGMDKVFVTIRNIIVDHSKKIQHRKELLDILEMRAKKWAQSASGQSQMSDIANNNTIKRVNIAGVTSESSDTDLTPTTPVLTPRTPVLTPQSVTYQRYEVPSDEEPLPRNWEARIDQYGSVFYIDHSNRTTTWSKPTANPTSRRQREEKDSEQSRQQLDRRYQSIRRTLQVDDRRDETRRASGLLAPPKNSHPRLRRSFSDSETTALQRRLDNVHIKAPQYDQLQTPPKRESHAVPIVDPNDELRIERDISELQKELEARQRDRMEKQSHAIPIVPPVVKENAETGVGPDDVARPLGGGGVDKRSRMKSKHKDARKYSREFLLACYDSPLTKDIPVMLHYTFLNSDTGFIVEKNSEDPRDLIRGTQMPPLMKSLYDTHGQHGRQQRLNSWPGPSVSSIPEAPEKDDNLRSSWSGSVFPTIHEASPNTRGLLGPHPSHKNEHISPGSATQGLLGPSYMSKYAGTAT